MLPFNMLATAAYILILSSNFLATTPQPLTDTTIPEETDPTPNNLEDTADQESEGPTSNFRIAFTSYEKRIRNFIDNIRRGYMAMNTDAFDFLEELRGYMEQLPKNETRSVTMKYRAKCYCEDQYWEPCPERCMDSCYIRSGPNEYGSCCYTSHFDNCTYSMANRASYCNCYEGSSTTCRQGVQQCHEEKTVNITENKPCLEFNVDQLMVEESFLRFKDLLIEPLKIMLRDLNFQTSSFKQAVIATDLLFDNLAKLCEGQETSCFPEATELLDQNLQLYKQRKRNITLEMIKTKELAEEVSKNVHALKEQTFAQISQSIKKYTCCLKSFNFVVKDNDCNPKPDEIAKTTMIPLDPPLPIKIMRRNCTLSNFQCQNKRCVPMTALCDGYDDCGDFSDEADC